MSTELTGLTQCICQHLSKKVPDFCSETQLDVSFSRLGLDSVGHVELTAVIAEYLQQEVEPTLAFDYPTVNALSDKLLADCLTSAPQKA